MKARETELPIDWTNQRTNTLPLKKFQVELTWSILIRSAITLFASVFACAICVLAYQFLAPESSWLIARFTEDVGAIVTVVVVPLLVSMITGFVIFLRWTFRLAGPLYRYQRSFEEIERGLLPRELRTREGDDLKFLTEQVQRGLKRVYSSHARIQVCYRKLSETLNSLSGPRSENVNAALEELGHAIRSLRLEDGTTEPVLTSSESEESAAA